jgi:hypothetical protein
MRLAWFSPMPPVPSGVAASTPDVVCELRNRQDPDVYT